MRLIALSILIMLFGCKSESEVRITDERGSSNTSGNTNNNVITPPNSITLTNPSTNSSIKKNPIVTVSGVSVGAVVSLYSDSNCSTIIGQESATSSSVQIETNALAIGPYTFYAKSSLNGSESSCSSASLNYTVTSCPAGYVSIAFESNDIVGVEDFCVMAYEAGEESSNIVSKSNVLAKVNVTPTQAKSLCTGIGANYDIISNLEWMAIALNVEKVAANWSGGAIGSGCLIRGNIGLDAAGCSFNVGQILTADSRTADQINVSRYELTSGDYIWDLSGNVSEWADYTLGGAMDYFTNSCPQAWESLFDNGCSALSEVHYLPGQTYASDQSSTYGLGNIINYTDGAIGRSGHFQYGLNGATALESIGVFLFTSNQTGRSYGNTGFRCVYRP